MTSVVTHRRHLRGVAVALITIGGIWAFTLHARAGSESAEELLIVARSIAERESYAGVVEVQWRDDSGVMQSRRLIARGVEGQFVVGVGVHRSVGSRDERYTSSDDEKTRVAGSAHTQPSPDAAWDLEIAGRRQVAGRSAVVVVARDDEGRTRAKFAIDRETGQLLRRAVLDTHGNPVHVVQFVSIIPIDDAAESTPVPEVPVGTDVTAPVAIKKVPEGFVSRDELGGGYELTGSYRQPDGSVQLYFSDGLFTLSLFETPGRPDWEAMPPGPPAPIEGVKARTYSIAAGTIVVWGQKDLVITAIGDGPRDRVMAVVEDFTGTGDESSWTDDVIDFILGPFDWD